MKLNYNYLSKYRNTLLGLSITEIVIFHYCADCVTASSYLGNPILFRLAKAYVAVLGSIGVDIFVLLSGLGLYFSFSKNSNLKDFYKKRFFRIIPTYLFVGGILWYIRDVIVLATPFNVFLEDFTTISFWKRGNTLVWYISFCILVYAFFPLFYKVINYSENYRLARTFGIILLIVVVMVISDKFHFEVLNRLEIAIARIPLFLIGIYLGDHVRYNKLLLLKGYIALLLAFVGGFSISKIFFEGFYNRIIIGIYAFLLAILLAAFFDRISSRFAFVINAFNGIGKHSLGLYLSHVMIRDIFKQQGIHTEIFYVYLIIVVLSMVFTVAETKVKQKLLGSKEV